MDWASKDEELQMLVVRVVSFFSGNSIFMHITVTRD